MRFLALVIAALVLAPASVAAQGLRGKVYDLFRFGSGCNTPICLDLDPISDAGPLGRALLPMRDQRHDTELAAQCLGLCKRRFPALDAVRSLDLRHMLQER